MGFSIGFDGLLVLGKHSFVTYDRALDLDLFAELS